MFTRGSVSFSVVAIVTIVFATSVFAQTPDHPIITEVFTDPPGLNDAPVGRDPNNLHQEYIELYLPPVADLNADLLLRKDAVKLTVYEVEGDSTSTGLGLINYRFDLPPFDLDPSNDPPGQAQAGSIRRPATGVVVLGWVDYVGNPPTDLAGADSNSRIALINGGITATPVGADEYTFIAINGDHFFAVSGGTSNFPVVQAESLIDLPAEASSGVIQNGSSAWLLVDRDAAGYVELCDDKHAADCIAGADPNLPSSTLGLKTTALLDGYASNDDSLFNVFLQPYVSPTGSDIDLETVLPFGGAFSMLIAQIPEEETADPDPGIANGYARKYVDVSKTTENASAFDDNPVQDAVTAYRHIRNDGPFFPTPGRVALTSFAPELSVASQTAQVFEVLAETTRQAGLLTANVGGNFPIDISVAMGASSDASVATFVAGAPANNVAGQSYGLPSVLITGGALAADGATATATATINAANSAGGPPVIGSGETRTITATVLNPSQGLNAGGQRVQATVFVAVEPIPADPGVLNEFLNTELGAFIQANLHGAVQDTRALGPLLLDPTTDLNNGPLMQSLIKDMPSSGSFVNYPGPGLPGTLDLVQTVVQSAEMLSGAGTYDASLEGVGVPTGVRAIRMNHPDVPPFGGTFTPSGAVHFAEAGGRVADPMSGLTDVTTTRTFELAIFDTNTRDSGALESGATDDFGLVIQVAGVGPGAQVSVGEFVFLSFSGGLLGADIDTVDVPPHNNVATLIYLDLDNLFLELGITLVEAVFIIDGDGSGELDVIEVFTLSSNGCQPGDPPCDDNDACTDNICTGPGTCEFPPNYNVATECCRVSDGVTSPLDDGNQCTDDLCDAVTGVVTHPFSSPTTSCNDGDVCTSNDLCDGAGNCAGTQIPNCGCLLDSECDDLVACTVDKCVDGSGLPCTTGPCSCVNTPDDSLCPDNGIHCDGEEICDSVVGCKSSGVPCPGCDEFATPPCPCEAPDLSPGGPRYLAIRPKPLESTVPVKLVVTSPDHPCLSKYVGSLRCTGSGDACRTDADCNACSFSQTPCLVNSDCDSGLCTNGQLCSVTEQNCADLSQCLLVETCVLSGDVCLPAPLETIDINMDGLIDGTVGVLVDNPADAAELTPAEWTGGAMRCSKSAAPCVTDADCPRGLCTQFNSFCNVLAQDCSPGAGTCVLDEKCISGAVYVSGEDIRPSDLDQTTGTFFPSRYDVSAECTVTIPPVTTTMWRWADTSNDSFLNVNDIFLIILAIQGKYDFSTIINDDLAGLAVCNPQQILNVSDTLMAIRAMQGEQFSDTECLLPCPP